jgi:hypothetical protein
MNSYDDIDDDITSNYIGHSGAGKGGQGEGMKSTIMRHVGGHCHIAPPQKKNPAGATDWAAAEHELKTPYSSISNYA